MIRRSMQRRYFLNNDHYFFRLARYYVMSFVAKHSTNMVKYYVQLVNMIANKEIFYMIYIHCVDMSQFFEGNGKLTFLENRRTFNRLRSKDTKFKIPMS